MTLKLRLIVLQFLQYFILGSWLLTIGAYWFQTKEWPSTQFGAIFSTIGLASLFMPALAGIVADRALAQSEHQSILRISAGAQLPAKRTVKVGLNKSMAVRWEPAVTRFLPAP